MNIADECKRIIERGTKPTLLEVKPIIHAWYDRPENIVGGELHCELEDGNLRDGFLIDNVLDERLSEDARLISAVLLMCSRSQRRRL